MNMALSFPPAIHNEIIRMSRRQRRAIKPDNILGNFSDIVSLLSAIAKLDGVIMQMVMFEAIKSNPDYELLWRPKIPITDSAERLAAGGDYLSCMRTDLPFCGTVSRLVEVDFVAINRVTGVATAAESKRGGELDSGKRHKIVENLVRVKMILADYLRSIGYAEVRSAEVALVVYYGTWSLKPIPTITRSTIDAHFGAAVTPMVAMAADLIRREMMGNTLPVLTTLLEAYAGQLDAPEMADTREEFIRILSEIVKPPSK